jgi:hypothetical protein
MLHERFQKVVDVRGTFDCRWLFTVVNFVNFWEG